MHQYYTVYEEEHSPPFKVSYATSPFLC